MYLRGWNAVCAVVVLVVPPVTAAASGFDVDDTWDALWRPRDGKHVYMTYLYGPSWQLYAEVVLVWAASIRQYDSSHDLVVLTVPDIPPAQEAILASNNLTLVKRKLIRPPYKNRHRRDLQNVWHKLNVFNCTNYSKIVLIDADCIAVDYSISDMFSYTATAAAAAWGALGGSTADLLGGSMPRPFNAGVMVVRPDERLFGHMMTHLHDFTEDDRLIDTQDQGWLNLYFYTFGGRTELPIRFNYDATNYRYKKYTVEYHRRIQAQGGPVVVHWPSSKLKPWQTKQYTRKYDLIWLDHCHRLNLSIC